MKDEKLNQDQKMAHYTDELTPDMDAEQLINDLKSSEGKKEFATLRLSKWVVDEYREFGEEVGLKKHGVLAERVLIAGLRELKRQRAAEQKNKP